MKDIVEIEIATRRRAWLEAAVESNQLALEGLKSGAQPNLLHKRLLWRAKQ